ncbi:hypothetical protein P4H42_12810 [Paenibacillus macerans]|uniref:hypothetical protein n=1 Tax=Paenibacillus macerans TaxID=44252 RepID=UPI002DB81D40|nr:hypothetical protein [Paenibacillus macerans]MEC0330494.1 hypothetical protein [Paenibacillus macerans]
MRVEMLRKTFNGMDAAEFKPFSGAIVKLLAAPLPIREFSGILHEMSDARKRRLLSSLNIKGKSSTNKPYPMEGLIHIIRAKSGKRHEKLKILQHILLSVSDLYEDDTASDESFLALEQEKKEQYGPWHYYWALRFFPEESAAIAKRIAELEQELPSGLALAPAPAPSRDKKELAKEEKQRIDHERGLRVQAERTIAKLKQELRTLEENLQRVLAQNNALQAAKAELEQELAGLRQRHEFERKRNSQLEHDVKKQRQETRKWQQAARESEKNAALALQNVRKEQDALQRRLSLAESPAACGDRLVRHFHEEAFLLMETLKRRGTLTGPEQIRIRKEISLKLDLINRLEEQFHVHPEEADYKAEAASSLKPPAPPQEIVQDRTTVSNKKTGIFYRKEHGGYIQLEDGDSFTVTESVVNAVGLEHEAEVECEPQKRPDGSVFQHITVLFQGDDAHAPIEQYWGYVELGEHHAYYCVDIQNPQNRFPIHEKDLEVQRPLDGDPCLFNVAAGGTCARLSKVFRNRDEMNRERGQAITGKRNTEKKKKSAAETEPFLQGCKIAVIGGQAKWFESVVKQTGAEFVHENGEHPERIFAELRKSNALFKLITATSHEATWAGVEIAKANGIPHFVLEGSKANLRRLLWENRELIRGSLQARG